MKKLKKFLEENILLLQIFVAGGIFGFLYEEIFYWFDLGIITKRGITFGPWIPIYAFGAIFITLICKDRFKKPYQVFLIGTILSGILEFCTGYLLYHIFQIRLWDYNVEILNYGNIGGYVCLRSVLFFGLSSLLLIYEMIPILKKVREKMNQKRNNQITIILFMLFIIDIIISCIIGGFHGFN